MAEREGVIKYRLDFHEQEPGTRDIAPVEPWRDILKRLALIGRCEDRYGGLGFGNLSMRTRDGFLITGTQTGHKEKLTLADYAEVTGWRLDANAIEARGRTKPSSEALTHAAIYDARPRVGFVFHCHSPDIWPRARDLGVIVTDAAVPYGTPDMAREVAARIADMDAADMLAMGGHEDGVVAFGADADETGTLLVRCLARALRLEK